MNPKLCRHCRKHLRRTHQSRFCNSQCESAFWEEWRAQLKRRADDERKREIITSVNKRRCKVKAVAKRRARRKVNKKRRQR
jgi:hypothetical protein